MPPPETEEGADWLRRLMIVTEVVGLAFTVWVVWELTPERYKLELRRWFRHARDPFDAAAARKRARVEMMADVLEVITLGEVPAEWTRVA